MKKTTLKAKIIAAVLAAVTAVSVGTMAMATTASAASLQTETIRTIAKLDDKTGGILGRISDKDLEKLRDVGIATVIAGIAEFVPGGKIMMPALQALAGSAFGNPKMTLEDIDKRIDGLYDRIEQFEKDMQNELKNIVSIENFDYSTFTPFNSQIEGIVKAVKTIKNSGNYTTKQKLAMIGAQIGRDLEWKKSSSPFVGFTSVTKKLNSANLVDNNDMFMTIYNYFKQRSMFSGEALDQTNKVISGIMKNYLAGYAILMECLSAQLQINALENKDGIEQYYLDSISTNIDEIKAKIDMLNQAVIGRPDEKGQMNAKDTVGEKYNNVLNINRMLFVNKGKSDTKLTGKLGITNHGDLYNKNEDQAVGSFNKIVLGGSHLDAGQIKDLANYAKGKNMSVRELLKANGINTDNVPQNANLVTAKAYDDQGIKDFFSGMVGSVHLHGLYKGINIDSKDASEKEICMWNHGCNGFLASTWDFAEAGCAVTVKTV